MAKLRNNIPRVLVPCLTALAIGVLADSAGAQVTSAQQSAIRANCRSDFMAKCSGVTPGGKDALVCLQKNVTSLSAACKSAVSATLPPPAPKAPAAAAAAPAAPADTAEPAAAAATPTTETEAAPDATAPAAPVVAAPPPKAAIAKPAKTTAVVATAAPTAAQQNAMKQACRSDFMAKCSGVTPGGKDALVCLQRNVAGLSPSCKQVVSATMGAPAAAVATAPAAMAVAPAAGPTPEQLKAVKFTCRRDFMRSCRGIEPGGPEALACLQRNAPRLTPDCRTSLAAIAESTPAGVAATSAPAASSTTVIVEERRRLPPAITPAGRIIRRVIERNQ
jgi:hypothetical protein